MELPLVVFELLKNDARQPVREISLKLDIGVAITYKILTDNLKTESFFAPKLFF